MSAIALSGHELLRCTCLLLTQSGHTGTKAIRAFEGLPKVGPRIECRCEMSAFEPKRIYLDLYQNSRCNIVRLMKRLIRRPDPLERDGVAPTS